MKMARNARAWIHLSNWPVTLTASNNLKRGKARKLRNSSPTTLLANSNAQGLYCLQSEIHIFEVMASEFCFSMIEETSEAISPHNEMKFYTWGTHHAAAEGNANASRPFSKSYSRQCADLVERAARKTQANVRTQIHSILRGSID